MKRPALQNKRVAVLGMALRARKVVGTFEKRAPDWNLIVRLIGKVHATANASYTGQINLAAGFNASKQSWPDKV